MRFVTLIFIMCILLPSALALSFTIEPTSQTVQAGSNFIVDVNLYNDVPIWGFSFQLEEYPASDIAFTNGLPQPRINGGLNSATENGHIVTVLSAFGGTTPGIATGIGSVYKLTYTVPDYVAPGTYTLEPEDLFVSDAQGQQLQADILGATITVENPNDYAGFVLPEEYVITGKRDYETPYQNNFSY